MMLLYIDLYLAEEMDMEIKKISGTALVAGSTSTLAILVGAAPALAGEPYIGFSVGAISGEHPGPGYSGSEDYELTGAAIAIHAGVNQQINDTLWAGVELSYQTNVEGDKNSVSSYEYGYDIQRNIDAKLRVGTTLGDIRVYGFGGVSAGAMQHIYYSGADYRYQGVNIGAGAEMELFPNITVGAEVINRQTWGIIDGDGNDYRASHSAISLRTSFQF